MIPDHIMWVFCKECDREVRVDEISETEYIERSVERGVSHHPKKACHKIYAEGGFTYITLLMMLFMLGFWGLVVWAVLKAIC